MLVKGSYIVGEQSINREIKDNNRECMYIVEINLSILVYPLQ